MSRRRKAGTATQNQPSRNGTSRPQERNHDLLYRLLQTPSPSGNECHVQEVLMEELAHLADTVEHDALGNVFFGLNTRRDDDSHQAARRPVVMLEAHADQVGFLVKHISENGYIYVEYLGGIDEVTLPGARVVFTPRRERDGLEPPPPFHIDDPVTTGVFSKKATHLQSSKEKHEAPTQSEIWIDIGATSKEEVEEKVRVGDTAVFEFRNRTLQLDNQRVVSPALDDRAGLFAIAETFKRCAEESRQGRLHAELWVVSTTQEEVGLRGATAAAKRVHPDVAIAVDVVNAADDPGNDKKTTIPCTLGNGPTISGGPNTNPVVAALLRRAADKAGVKFQQLQSAELEGNDSKSMQVAGRGIAIASVGIPNRAMHTQVEVCHLRDIDDTVDLLTEFVRTLDEDVDFRPLAGRATSGLH